MSLHLPNYFLYFEDLELNSTWESMGRTVTETDVVNFAGFSGDFNPIHIDHEYAKDSPFRRPIAHGFAVFSMTNGLGLAAPFTRIVALIGVRNWVFAHPVFFGDTVRIRSTVLEKTVRGRGKRGEVVWKREIVNQHEKIVQHGEMTTIVECRTSMLPNEPGVLPLTPPVA
jgi:3-hydroxybutyryl-CoA dehydratase